MAQTYIQEEEETVKSGDRWIWGIYITLCIISVIESYTALSQVVGKQGLYAPLLKHCGLLGSGFLILWTIQRLHYTKFIFWIKAYAILAFGSVVAVQFLGDDVNGAVRAIPVPGLGTLQPAELAKLAIATAIPLVVSRYQICNGVTRTGAFWSVTIVCCFAAFLFMQGFTNTMLIMTTSIVIMWVGGIKVRQLGVVFIVYALVGASLYTINKSNKEKQRKAQTEMQASAGATSDNAITVDEDEDGASVGRSSTWMNRVLRWKHNHDSLVYMPKTAKNEQEMYAHMAQANGGILGVGPGNSRECSRLPLAYSDYIYSIIVEETGLIGGVIVLILYLWILIRAGLIASRCARALPALLIMGTAVMITFQALVHMAINTGLFPVSGQSLPLISEGGTSVWCMSAAFGIMLSVSRHASQNTIDKMKKKDEQNLPKEEQAPNPMQIIINNE